MTDLSAFHAFGAGDLQCCRIGALDLQQEQPHAILSVNADQATWSEAEAEAAQALPPLGWVSDTRLGRAFGVGPLQWLIEAECAPAEALQRAAHSLPQCTFTDQTDGWAAVSVRGASVDEIDRFLERLVNAPPKDALPARCVRTRLSQLPVILVRQRGETMRLFCARSYAKDLWTHLCVKARMFEPQECERPTGTFV